MTSPWDKAISFVLAYEGGYINSPLDPGGETNMGISKRAYPSLDIKNLTFDQAKQIYRVDYWDAISGDELPGDVAMAVFDCAVNQGVGTAIRILQISLGVDVDGKVGPQTIRSAFECGDNAVWIFLLERAKAYMQIKDVVTWGSNWGSRLIQLGKAIFSA